MFSQEAWCKDVEERLDKIDERIEQIYATISKVKERVRANEVKNTINIGLLSANMVILFTVVGLILGR